MFGEYKAGGTTSESMVGFKLAFNSGLFQGTFNTEYKATSQLTLMVDQMLQASVQTGMDFVHDRCTFGVGLSFGGG